MYQTVRCVITYYLRALNISVVGVKKLPQSLMLVKPDKSM